MKIPDTTANVGAYYGSEENGQWQPNGVIIDSGVGGGVVGSGDAGIHRPPVYPVHLPRGHIPGYVMAGAYYPPAPYAPVPPPQDDFADYMWMENEEEFDKQVMQQLEEEALMEQCIEAMLEDEQRERHRPVANGHNHHYPTTSNGSTSLSLEETVSRSKLNPLAAEFVPTFTRSRPASTTATPATTTEEKRDKTESVEISSPETHATDESTDQIDSKHTETSTEDSVTEREETPETPEVSAADVQTDKRKDRKDIKKIETKKPVKQEVKKTKPVIVKAETKVQPKKKEVKVVKSETKAEEKSAKVEEVVTEVQPQLPSAPTPVEEPSTPGIKPINYAAAAKANKPKKPSTPPATDKTTPPPLKTEKKPEQKVEQKKPKAEKPAVQRKNSAK
ncbi:microtubule-associated protein 1B isoform X2 [Achroia grisella]|uniref:microtubule-associated protein 1B isoform X2 n=1 Tax=Achroia grisella TaxID=688607 RepID=UPI0027D34DAF|nr:microtubule-associated protein 1B isoform X2 [Achroia grisella]